MKLTVVLVISLAMILAMASSSFAQTTQTTQPRNWLLIAHRGASGHRPEHTLAAYQTAIDMGADFIEPDLVLTKDGVLIARHEPLLASVDPKTGELIEATTNVADHPQFATRKRTRSLDGKPHTGWWSDDFTRAEIKTLRARERLPELRPNNKSFDDQFEIPTFAEILALAKQQSQLTGRAIGVYPETKHPTFFSEIFGPNIMEDKLLLDLRKTYTDSPAAPVFIQSFEVANLQYLKTQSQFRLMQLMSGSGGPYDFTKSKDARSYADLATPDGLKFVATYATGIGAEKGMVIPRDKSGELAAPTSLVAAAHASGLLVHCWTFRAENNYLPKSLRSSTTKSDLGDLPAEIRPFLDAGIDGLFSDHPDLAARAKR